MKLRIDYPSAAEEHDLGPGLGANGPWLSSLSVDELKTAQAALHGVHIDDRLKGYCVDVVRASRPGGAAGDDLGAA